MYIERETDFKTTFLANSALTTPLIARQSWNTFHVYFSQGFTYKKHLSLYYITLPKWGWLGTILFLTYDAIFNLTAYAVVTPLSRKQHLGDVRLRSGLIRVSRCFFELLLIFMNVPIDQIVSIDNKTYFLYFS
jgi:hypothetical protein